MHSHSVVVAQETLTALLWILLIGTLGGKLSEKLRVPDVVLYILIGIVLGPSVLHVVDIKADSALNQIILLFGASFILFHGGTITQFAVLRKVWRTVTLLSTLGVLLTAFVVASAAFYMFHLPFTVALLIGAILASTDPAALVPIFQRFPVRQKVAQTVIVESAFTDATGAIVTTVVFGILTSASEIQWGHIGLQFVQLAIGGLIVGAVVGLIAAFLISENDRDLLRQYTPMVVVLVVLSAYLLAEWRGASGFMSVFTAGIMVGNARSFKLTILENQTQAAEQFLDTIGLKFRMLIFILLGTQVDFGVLKEYGLQALIVIIIFMLVARPITVLACLLPDRKAKWQRNEVLFLFWTRETGVIAAALAGIVGSSNVAQGKLISAIVFVAILMTLVVQASTTPAVAKKLKLLAGQQEEQEEF
jgi:potassium/hydrogen antiporter